MDSFGGEIMKKVVIIQARMGSTRLPGKVMLEIKGKTVLTHVVERVKYCKNIDDIVVATSLNKNDDLIVKECVSIGVNHFRGSEQDVLSRYYHAARKNNADLVIRITADCPLIDYTIIDNMIEKFLEKDIHNNVDYMSNFDVIENTFPRGMDVEIIKANALEKTYQKAKEHYEREHVTPYIYNNPDKFNLLGYSNNVDLSKYRFTLDTREDLQLIKIIYDNLYEGNHVFGINDIIEFVNRNPQAVKINENVVQKSLEE